MFANGFYPTIGTFRRYDRRRCRRPNGAAIRLVVSGNTYDFAVNS